TAARSDRPGPGSLSAAVGRGTTGPSRSGAWPPPAASARGARARGAGGGVMTSGNSQRQIESWATKVGVILAVAGSAVGLGNFLRFPGRAALYGGGAFMIPYFVSLLLLGIPICLIEW